MKSTIIIVALALSALLLAGQPVSAQYHNEEVLQQTAREIYGLIMCPLCAGQTIGQSNNETSSQMRDLVLKKLRQGETKEEILQYFESRYGERILAKPPKKGFNLMLWVFPFALVVFAAFIIYFVIRRWASKIPVRPAGHINQSQFAEYNERLEKELEQFDEG